MSRASIAVATSRPTLVDYIFLLVGGSLSLYLLSLSPLLVKPSSDNPSTALRAFVAFLPAAMRLPEGIVLMGPIFYLMQLLRRRGWGLTSLEWLWTINGLGVAVLAGLAVWHRSDTLPAFMQPYATMPPKLWYLIFVPSMAALAALLGIVGMVRRVAVPWTHTFGFVLLLWPIAPLLGIISLGKFM
ncbi:MAG TPA: hypothetical protein VN688_32780 [Gemmataceae bacterium]|nr:hypothetical protein [Gemmataceae bacterium]